MELNPYIGEDNKPELKRSVIAYIDILGYSDFIKNAQKNNSQPALLSNLREALDESFAVMKDGYSDSTWGKRIYEIKAFSDNIVIGYPLVLSREDAESELGHMYFHLQFFQMSMVRHGFFIRGAISIGDLYLDQDIAFGNGLIEAYTAEQKLARDPRIVLTPEAETLVKQHLTYYADGEQAPQNRDLLLDIDGKMFVNYLDTLLIAEEEAGPLYEDLKKHKEIVEGKLHSFLKEPPKWSKYLWVANYHNAFCQHNNFDDEYKINLNEFHIKPSKIVS